MVGASVALLPQPFNLLLSVLGLVSYATDDLTAALVIGAMVFISTFMHFIQEARSNKAADALKAMVSNTATVLRSDAQTGRSETVEIAISQLVPGDLIKLSAGDMIPADLRILSAKDLFISQAALTGESLPVESTPAKRNPSQRSAGTQHAVLYGHHVARYGDRDGDRDGSKTWFANSPSGGAGRHSAERLSGRDQQVSWLLIRFMMVMTPWCW